MIALIIQIAALAFGAVLLLTLNHRLNAATRWGFVALAAMMVASRIMASGVLGDGPPPGLFDVQRIGGNLLSVAKCGAFLLGCAGLYDQLRSESR